MVTISKPISAGQAQAYHKEEFANAKENYYTEGERVRGEWQGQLAERWGLTGEVKEEQFARLSEGQHPETGEQLVRHQTAREYENERGVMVRSMEHRAGWDATFSAHPIAPNAPGYCCRSESLPGIQTNGRQNSAGAKPKRAC
jgi:hypothetical protein